MAGSKPFDAIRKMPLPRNSLIACIYIGEDAVRLGNLAEL